MIESLAIPVRWRRVCASLCTALCAATTTAAFGSRALHAQSVSAPVASPGMLSGVVVDSAGRPVSDANVLLYQTQSALRTRSDGTFRFDGVASGKYTIEVRHIGYKQVTSKVTLKDAGLSVTIKLDRVPFFLPSVLTTADRGGLSGVIADTAYKPVAKVRVTVLGANASIETDSAGAFFMPVKPGHYMVGLTASMSSRA